MRALACFVLLASLVSGLNVPITATVANSAPAVNATSYIWYNNETRHIKSDNFAICGNAGANITWVVEIIDANTISEITGTNYTIHVPTGTLTGNLLATPKSVTSAMSILRTALDAGSYSMAVTTSDMAESSSSTAQATAHTEDCEIYETEIQDRLEPIEVGEILISAAGSGLSYVSVLKHKIPKHDDDFGLTPGEQYTFRMSSDLCDEQVYAYVPENGNARAYYWDGLGWSIATQLKENGMLKVDVGCGTEIAMFKGSSARCEPLRDCMEWSSCMKGWQIRECDDRHGCGGKLRPVMKRRCSDYMPVTLPLQQMPMQTVDKVTLFDIVLELPNVGDDELIAKISLTNFGDPGRTDATLHYVVTGESGKAYIDFTEIVPVETQTEFLKTIITSGLPDGEYLLRIDLTYQGQEEPASAERQFSKNRKSRMPYYALPVLAIIGLLLFWRRPFAKARPRQKDL